MNKEEYEISLKDAVKDKINLLEDSINCNYELTRMERKAIIELLQEYQEETDRLNKECDTYMKIATKRGSIIEELEKYMKSLYIVGHTINNATLDSIFYKLKELKEGNNENNNKENN